MARLSRRRFLGGALAAGAGGLLAACDGDRDATHPPSDSDTPTGSRPTVEPFRGHQEGITTPPPTAAAMVALDAAASSTTALVAGFRALSAEVGGLMVDGPTRRGGEGALDMIVAVGASLFDERYGLADRVPRELTMMPPFANDELDPAMTHGDVLLTVSGDRSNATDAALRRVVAATDGAFGVRWTLTGGNARSHPGRAPRNPMGFLDGTSNPDTTQEGVMRRFVWVQSRDEEPDWTAGGSYQVVRVIKMDLDEWERVGVASQERIIGRRKDNGSPLSGGTADDVPDYRDDPDGAVTALDAHIRLANPRDRSTEYDEILRRGFSYERADEHRGSRHRGLAFVAFQRSLRRGFLAIQSRLDGEPLERFTVTEGGGFYFALPGVAHEDDWLGRTMLEGV